MVSFHLFLTQLTKLCTLLFLVGWLLFALYVQFFKLLVNFCYQLRICIFFIFKLHIVSRLDWTCFLNQFLCPNNLVTCPFLTGLHYFLQFLNFIRKLFTKRVVITLDYPMSLSFNRSLLLRSCKRSKISRCHKVRAFFLTIKLCNLFKVLILGCNIIFTES